MPLLYENKKAKFLNILKNGLNPFKKFVATGEIKEEIGMVKSRKAFFETIREIIKENENFIQPIIGGVGVGKTHLFWALKRELLYNNSIYISLENVYRKFHYNLYTELIDTLTVEALRSITNKLCNEWGALEKKFGFFHIADIEKIRKKGYEMNEEKFLDRVALLDVVNAITAHQLDPYKRHEAENWLLGELMELRDLARLNLMHDLRGKNNAFTLLKFVIENAKLGTVLFIDDFEKIISMLNPQDETDDIFDPSYFYGNENSPNSSGPQKMFKNILQLQEIKGLKILITLKTVDALEEIKDLIKERNPNLLLTFKEPVFIMDFTESDIFSFYKKNMEYFIRNIEYLDFLEEFPDTFYPLNERTLKNIFEKGNGNPREIIKLLIRIFNDIIYTDEKLEDILSSYDIFA